MSEPIDRPKALEFDFDQWRNDIQTFAEETEQALHSIISDLAGREPLGAASQPASVTSGPSHARSLTSEPTVTESPPNQRLASLKEKLAKRLNQPKT